MTDATEQQLAYRNDLIRKAMIKALNRSTPFSAKRRHTCSSLSSRMFAAQRPEA